MLVHVVACLDGISHCHLTVRMCVGVILHAVYMNDKLKERSLVKETIYGHDALNAPVPASGLTAHYEGGNCRPGST